MLDAKTLQLIEAALAGNRRAVSRLITLAENDRQTAAEISKQLYLHTGGAKIIGVTGPPGAGKSTLVDKLAKLLRAQGCRVGILAVDPSSPFSGGAILGDRIRMGDLTLDEGVYIRSMSTRGYLGGLSAAVSSAAGILDACGCDYILVETVGVGQSEIEIVKMADTTVVVSVPGLGDDIQMIKAGILEIGDILVVNKADRDGAQQLASMLKRMQQLGRTPKSGGWTPPVVMCNALNSEGVDQLLAEILRHLDEKTADGSLKQLRIERLAADMQRQIRDALYDYFEHKHHIDAALQRDIEAIYSHEIDPYTWVGDAVAVCVREEDKSEK